MEKIVKYLLFVLFLILTITVSYNYGKINKLKELLEYIELKQNTKQTFTHTISDVIFDTVYQDKYIPYYEIDTVLLKDTVTDTTTDTIILTDTVYLENQIGVVDTLFTDTVNNQIVSNELHLRLSGYEVSLDTLCLNTIITQPRKKWYERIVPAIGIGITTNCKIGIFAGVGYGF